MMNGVVFVAATKPHSCWSIVPAWNMWLRPQAVRQWRSVWSLGVRPSGFVSFCGTLPNWLHVGGLWHGSPEKLVAANVCKFNQQSTHSLVFWRGWRPLYNFSVGNISCRLFPCLDLVPIIQTEAERRRPEAGVHQAMENGLRSSSFTNYLYTFRIPNHRKFNPRTAGGRLFAPLMFFCRQRKTAANFA